MIYAFWGHGISVYSDKKEPENYYIAEIDGKQDTVFVQYARNIKDIRTFFNHRLNYGNHTIKIYGDKYAFTKLVKYVDSNPNPPYYYKDSLIIHWDTLTVINPVPVDSLYTNPVPVDSSYINPIALDSPYFVPVKVDSPYMVPIKIDSPYWVGLPIDSPYTVPVEIDSPYYVPRPIEKPCQNCPDDSNNWWAWVIGGLSIALSLFVILYLTK